MKHFSCPVVAALGFGLGTGLLTLVAQAQPSVLRRPGTVVVPDATAIKGGVELPVANQLAIIQADLKKLKDENAALRVRLDKAETTNAQLIKDVGAMKFLFPSLDKLVGQQKADLKTLQTAFDKHQHGRYFHYQPLEDILKVKSTHSSIMIPYVSLGADMFGVNPLSQSDAIKKAKAAPMWDRTTLPLPPK